MDDMDYFVLFVLEKIMCVLGMMVVVLVLVRVNSLMLFLVSFYLVGGGWYYIWIKVKVWKEVKIMEGDWVKVEIMVIDCDKVVILKDLVIVLCVVDVEVVFKVILLGKWNYMIWVIDEVVKFEMCVKRI